LQRRGAESEHREREKSGGDRRGEARLGFAARLQGMIYTRRRPKRVRPILQVGTWRCWMGAVQVEEEDKEGRWVSVRNKRPRERGVGPYQN
jgi:hypothetical protein